MDNGRYADDDDDNDDDDDENDGVCDLIIHLK